MLPISLNNSNVGYGHSLPTPSSVFKVPYPPQPVSVVRAVCPLPNSCTFCVTDFLRNVATTSFKLPAQVEVPAGGGGYAPPRFRSLGETTFLDDNQNDSYISYLRDQCTYLPRSHGTRSRILVNGRGGSRPDIWFKQKRQERHTMLNTSRKKVGKIQKELKRLQNHRFMRQWKFEKRRSLEEKESIRQSKLDVLRRKGIKSMEKTECTLWNCPRKEYRRKRPFMPLHPLPRSPSQLSNLSVRDRSPIVFRRAT